MHLALHLDLEHQNLVIGLRDEVGLVLGLV